MLSLYLLSQRLGEVRHRRAARQPVSTDGIHIVNLQCVVGQPFPAAGGHRLGGHCPGSTEGDGVAVQAKQAGGAAVGGDDGLRPGRDGHGGQRDVALFCDRGRVGPADGQYLRTVPPFNRGYWVDKPDTSGEISIARTGFPGGRIYYLYQTHGTKLQVSQLPGWQTENYNYRSLAVGNLYTRKVLPETVYSVDGELVTLKIGYLYPPAEMNLIKLYSWPLSYSGFPHDFNRTMNRDVFEELRYFFEQLGYSFKEE